MLAETLLLTEVLVLAELLLLAALKDAEAGGWLSRALVGSFLCLQPCRNL